MQLEGTTTAGKVLAFHLRSRTPARDSGHARELSGELPDFGGNKTVSAWLELAAAKHLGHTKSRR